MLVREIKAPDPVPLWASWRSAKVDPDFILNYFEVRMPVVPVRDIAQKMGVLIHAIDADDASGAVQVKDGRAFVFTNAREAEVRQRFTIAHELGHLLHHVTDAVPMFRDLKYTNASQEEIQANQFAAELLMPAWMMWKVAATIGRDPRRLAAAFDVSLVAMQYRMINVKMA